MVLLASYFRVLKPKLELACELGRNLQGDT
jgi:hypothetical protein